MLLSEKWQITNDDDTLNYQLGKTIEVYEWEIQKWEKENLLEIKTNCFFPYICSLKKY